MSFFDSMNVSASALTAQRMRMDVISENMANIETTRGEDGVPYKRKITLFQEMSGGNSFETTINSILNKPTQGNGVKVSRVVEDERPGRKVYNEGHPDADEEGYVTMPNVNIVEEMVNMISASRSYEANVTAINITKSMMAKTLEIGRS